MPDYPLSQNNRTYYATHAVALGEIGADANTVPSTGGIQPVSGLQSVGVNTTFNLEQVFQLGQLEIYENIENIPDVEVTLEKVLDGAPLIQHLCTPQTAGHGLATRYNNNRTDVHIGFYSDEFENASGVNQSELYVSGMYVSSLSITLPTDGNATESVTLVGNDKFWSTGQALQHGATPESTGEFFFKNQSMFGPNGAPTATGHEEKVLGVLRRQDVRMSGCVFPSAIPGLTPLNGANTGIVYQGGGGNGAADDKLFVPCGSGLASTGTTDTKGDFLPCLFGTTSEPLGETALANAGSNASGSKAAPAGNIHPVHMSSITISTDLGRTDLFELGRRGPYHRFADFPTEVTCAIEVIEREFGDFVNAEGDADSNVNDSPIFIMLGDGTLINLGRKNKLASVTSSGGDTGGGNRTTTYNFSNFNSYQVHHRLDPAVHRKGGVSYSAFDGATGNP